MAFWIQIAALIAALGIIYQKVLRPLIKGIGIFEEIKPLLPLVRSLVPLLQDLNEQLGGKGVLEVLREIADEFRSDSGSSLKDAINRIEEAAQRAKLAADETDLQLARAVSSLDTLKQEAETVAEDLAARRKAEDDEKA